MKHAKVYPGAIITLIGAAFIIFTGFHYFRFSPIQSIKQVSTKLPFDKKQEIISERSKFGKVYAVAPGKKAMVLSAEPVHYLDNQGQWQEINLKINLEKKNDFPFGATQNEFKAYFKSSSKDDYLVSFEEGDRSIQFGIKADQPWASQNIVSAKVSGNQITYPNIFSGVDLHYAMMPTQMLEEFIVKDSKTAALISTIDKKFKLKNTGYQVNSDGSINFDNFKIPAPVMYEVNNPKNNSLGIYFKITPQDGFYLLQKVITPEGKKWLADPQRKFPVVIDDTVGLNESNLTAVGDGYVRTNATVWQRFTTAIKLDVGNVADVKYRSFAEYDTTPIPDTADIQSIGLYINLVNSYGSGNTINIVRMDNALSTYTNDTAGNTSLFNAIGSPTATYVTNSTNFQATGHAYINLGYKLASSQVVTDLMGKLVANTPFGIGFLGSNETTSGTYTEWFSSDYTTAESRPELVIFYHGVEGTNDRVFRPLRDSFWDGTYHWVFFKSGNNTDYYYSTDGTSWTKSGTLNNYQNNHFGVWYESGNTKVWSAYHQLALYGNLYAKVGTLSGTSISWGDESTVFTGDSSNGYDFPTIIRDTNGYCWAGSRYYTATTQVGYVVAKSTTTDCTAWGATTTLEALTTVGSVLNGGGYIVPLTGGKLYAVYKHETDLLGKYYDGSSWGSEETIDATVATGTYNQGMSIVAIGDVVHLVYIDSDGSLKYMNRNGSWNTAITLDSAASFYSPALSLDTAKRDLYVIYRNNPSQANTGSVYYRKGVTPYAAANWGSASTTTTTSWASEPSAGSAGAWPLISDYSSNGVIDTLWVEGIYGLESNRILNSPDTTAPVTTDNGIDGFSHNTNVTISFNCSDAGGCANTYYTTDGSIPTTSSSSGTSFTLTANGKYTVKYFSVDYAGNTESIKTAANKVMIDETNPSASNFGPPPACGDKPPGRKTPWIYSAIAQSQTSISLFFTDADDPVSYYTIQFGSKSGKYPYGLTNIGKKGMGTYLVNDLNPGTKYYFKIRAGNGCAPGDWSNEISATTKSIKSSSSSSDKEVFNIVSTPTPQLPITNSETKPTITDNSQKPLSGTETVLSGSTENIGIINKIRNFFSSIVAAIFRRN